MKLIQDSPSKEGQDSFAMNMLQWKENGFYLETGAYMPHEYSNTYSLEKFFSWKGLSIEINKEWSDKFNSERDNPCYCADSITFNYLEALEKNNAPSQIDYLQLDVDPNYQTLATLKSLPHDQYRFSVITFEHDLYADRIHGINDGAMVQEESRKIFNELYKPGQYGRQPAAVIHSRRRPATRRIPRERRGVVHFLWFLGLGYSDLLLEA